MKKFELFILLFLLFIGGGVVLAWNSGETLSLSMFTGLFAYVLVVLIPGKVH